MQLLLLCCIVIRSYVLCQLTLTEREAKLNMSLAMETDVINDSLSIWPKLILVPLVDKPARTRSKIFRLRSEKSALPEKRSDNSEPEGKKIFRRDEARYRANVEILFHKNLDLFRRSRDKYHQRHRVVRGGSRFRIEQTAEVTKHDVFRSHPSCD